MGEEAERGGKAESRRGGGLIIQRGEEKRRKEKKDVLERESVFGLKQARYSLCKLREVQRAGEKE